ARPEGIEQAVPVIRDIDFGMNYRHDELRYSESSRSNPSIDACQSGVCHGRGEIREWRAVIDTVHDDVLVEIESARGVLHEKAHRPAGIVDRKQKCATAA